MRISLFLFLSFAYTINGFAQTQDLLSLARGEFLGMNALYDEKENLFGYISMYDYGKSGDSTKKFEYVILDKNLNPVANKAFEGDITAGNYAGYINFNGKVVLRPTYIDYSLVNRKTVFMPSSMEIDLKENSIQKKVFYEYDHGTFKELLKHETLMQTRLNDKIEKKENGFNYSASVIEIKEGGYIVLEYDDYIDYQKNNHIRRYDTSKKELWDYEYNKTGSKSASELLYPLNKDENYLYGMLRVSAKREEDKFYLVVVDMKTGKEVHKKEIEAPVNALSHLLRFYTLSYGELDNDKAFDDKIVIVGRTSDLYAYTGFSRLIVDKKTFAADLRTISYMDFKGHIPKISTNGYVERGFSLDPRDIFIMKDGSVGILFEKYKAAGEYNAQKTTDLVYAYMDKDFKVAGAKIFEKEKSKWQNSDYLFSQTLNNGNDMVFFYRDYQKDEETKDRNWNLFINTLISGTFKQEMIPISSKENFVIIPYIAKEGYILLQEFNKKAKYNQVRLERLNY